MPEKFLILFIAYAVIDQDQAISIFNQQTTHGPCAHIVFIGWIEFVPHGFWYYPEHGTAVEFEEAGIDGMKLHMQWISCKCRELANWQVGIPPLLRNAGWWVGEYLERGMGLEVGFWV